MTKEKRKLFKDYFDLEAAQSIANQFLKGDPTFPSSLFIQQATNGISELEMQDRVWQFADALATALPSNKEEALKHIIKSLPPKLPSCEGFNNHWILWPLGHFIARYATDHFEQAFEAMTELTMRFSSEFAVRPYVELYPDQVFQKFTALAEHPNPHVRRWCSEGIRPLLPWGKKLHALVQNPAPIFPILEKLKDDPELYVRRSVANTLNDITKSHPDKVITLCQKWAINASDDRKWLIKHALRSLIKAANPHALSILGYHPPQQLEVCLKLKQELIQIGDSLDLTCQISSPISQNLMVDFIVHYVRKNGSCSEKVFKWKNFKLNGQANLTKKQAFRITSVRALYPGKHRIQLQINGKRMAQASFLLNK